MQTLITIAVFLIIFSLLILVHEMGHFLAAKKAGIKVYEFGIGMPPRAWGKKIGKTLYSINWVPFGGFVRMLGVEDPTSDQSKKSDSSFLNKPMRSRMLVAVAGVLMNFLLAFLLLTFGFWIGIEPLIITSDDFLDGIKEGQVVTAPGFYVYGVSEGSIADFVGFEVGDKLISRNGAALTDLQEFYALAEVDDEGDTVVFEVERGGSGEIEDISMLMTEGSLGLDLYLFEIPRIAVYEVEEGSAAYKAGLRADDVILKASGEEIFYLSEYQEGGVDYEVWRDGEILVIEGEEDVIHKAVISEVVYGSPADIYGLQDGDLILSIDGVDIYEPEDVFDVTASLEGDSLRYVVYRDEEEVFMDIARGEDGLVGIYVTELDDYEVGSVSVYETTLTTSVIEILPVRHGVFGAPLEAFREIGRLSLLTVGMLKDFLGELLSSGEISDNVAGPVGIAQMTHVFVQEGFAAVLRFVALLSLALGVFNIVPFPALDGGRFLFLFFEAVTGKRPNAKIEAALHSIGFILLMFLIVAVTYQDVVRLVSGG